MKLSGKIYDFGDDSPGNHLHALANEIAERLAINDAGDGDDEEARGAELAGYLHALANHVNNEAIHPHAQPLHEALRALAARAKYLPDHVRRTLQEIAHDVEEAHSGHAQRILEHEGHMTEIALGPSYAQGFREDYAALLTRAKNALASENYRAAGAFLLALDTMEADT